MPEATNRRVRFVMYDANEWLHAMADLDLAERGLWMTISNLNLIHGGPIPNDARWIARRSGLDVRSVAAGLKRLLAAGSMANLLRVSAESPETLVSINAESALIASSNYLENKKTGSTTRARKESSSPLQEKKIPKLKADDAARASLGGGASSPSAENEHEKVVQLRPRYPGCDERWESCAQRWQARGTVCQQECRPQVPGYRALDDDEVAERCNQDGAA